jgi:hypothetical protein
MLKPCVNIAELKRNIMKFEKHGLTKHKLYQVRKNMIGRCYTKSYKPYPKYGGRGIKVCKEWKDSMKSFYDWAISAGYKEGLSIDRIDNDKGYYPENCRFTDRKTQQNNTGWALANILTIDEMSDICELYANTNITLKEIAKNVGVTYKTISKLINGGYSQCKTA